MSAKLTPWFSLTEPPIRDGEYDCHYSKRDLGICDVFRAVFRNGIWYDLYWRKLSGLNHDPECFEYRGLTEQP